MNLNYFSEQTLPKIRQRTTGLCKVTLGKAGTLTVNLLACEKIGIKAGDKITIAQDADTPENWYLFKDMEHGFELKQTSSSAAIAFCHSALRAKIVESVDLSLDETHTALLAGIPTTIKGSKTEYWGLIPIKK